jgi:hypothetical protein
MSYSIADYSTSTAKIYISNKDNNVIIGHNSYEPLIQQYKNCNIVGNNVPCTGSNQVQLGDSAVNVYSPAGVQNTSDLRDKTQIRDTILGLSFIERLRPVDFKWNFRGDYEVITDEYEIRNGVLAPVVHTLPNDGSKTRSRFHHGLIAQEVKQTMTDMGVDFGGYQDHTINGGKDQLTISYTELVGPLIKSIQELKAQVDALQAEVNTLKSSP